MNRPLVGTLATVVLGAAALAGTAGTAGAAPRSGTEATSTFRAPGTISAPAASGVHTRTADFAGTVALDNCSGSIIKLPTSKDTDPALVMTNGHCLESGMPGAGEVITGQPSSRAFTVLDASAGDLGTLKATKVVYATMTDTDVTLYETGSSYADIQQKYGIKPLELDTAHPTDGHRITVVSGYWKQTYSCSIDGFVPQLKEGDWTWKDSVRYTTDCKTIGGTSGSPVIDEETGKVTAINNTVNEDGEKCTLNNPCEVDENGQVSVHKGTPYGQETYGIAKCFTAGNKLDLNASGCELPKPSGVRR
ncbi:S1 family peptidase [Streptomyces sp. NPDC002067]